MNGVPVKRFAQLVSPMALSLLTLATFAFVPGAAEACAVCFQAKTDASRIAFIAATAGMTVLPLLLVMGLAWWVRKRFRDTARDLLPEASRSDVRAADGYAQQRGVATTR